MNEDPLVRLEVAAGVATIELNDPQRMNPLSEELITGLEQRISQLQQNRGVRVVVLTARGRGFCVGADLTHYGNLIHHEARASSDQSLSAPNPHSHSARVQSCATSDLSTSEARSVEAHPAVTGPRLGAHVGRLMERMNGVVQQLHELHVPTICAVNGIAAGGGVGLALAADLVVAARSAYFYLPFFPSLGAVPDLGSSWVLPRTIGYPRALGLALTGEKLPAAQAHAWGLIWACVDDAKLLAEARALSHRLAKLPPKAALEARAILKAGQCNDLSRQLELERARQMVLVEEASFAEGVRAFIERRAPDFYRD